MKTKMNNLIKQLHTENARGAASKLRSLLKEEGATEEFYELCGGDFSCVRSLLEHEDAKVRKSGALLLGQLEDEDAVELLWNAYEKETQRFVKSSYLKAMQNLDCEAILEKLRRRLQELYQFEAKEEEEKHLREETHEMQKLLSLYEVNKGHAFIGNHRPSDLLLTMPYGYGQLLAKEYPGVLSKVMSLGVRMKNVCPDEVIDNPLYGEMLFALHLESKISLDAKSAARALVKSDLKTILKHYHEGEEGFRFRVQLAGRMEEKEKAKFLKAFIAETEKAFGGYLQNDPSDYEIEIRFYQTTSGLLQPFLKLFTIEERRFAYRSRILSTAMRPQLAALALTIARTYLTEGAHVLDPLCGTGTLLIERYRQGRVGAAFGIDTYGEAIEAAMENATKADRRIHFIHRDYFDATFKEKFDELICELPLAKQSAAEEEAFYQKFFDATAKIMKPGAVVILLSTQGNRIKKQIRLHPQFSLKEEHLLRKKDELFEYILRYK
ncbi:methyltransferase domain-containing protein [Eubacterium oxidoreducens]|uniref:tRNA G10 N-methylase Trm11 n=1 Tax=Eubacterium oxidoreducens TaxID=1732 RepID=A0A1G6AVF2_EUBOX|nr:methyltransferase domain-containing protein [Eubacterium oxidoreducens]SDB12345.1 tRNA G10 N-methylase Trm11 [Eubacterium oxidoreducens]